MNWICICSVRQGQSFTSLDKMLSSSVVLLQCLKSHCPPLYQGTSVESRVSIHLVSGSVLNNFMGLSLKGHSSHNPNKVWGISQEDLTVREPKVTQGQSESCSRRRDSPGLQQWGFKEGRDAVTVQWIKFMAPLCQHLPTWLHRTKKKCMFNGNTEFR